MWPEKIFPLACPVEELRWIHNWEYELVYTKSGVNENNCIFRETMLAPLLFNQTFPTTWIATVHDPEKCRMHFVLLPADKAVIKVEFQCNQLGSDISRCTWYMTFTALDEETNKMAENEVRENMNTIMTFLSGSLKHYCEIGEMLKD